jgi:hypothetical protein
MPDTITASHTVAVEDVEYQKGMLARLYRPSGAGPFPGALQVRSSVKAGSRSARTSAASPIRRSSS